MSRIRSGGRFQCGARAFCLVNVPGQYGGRQVPSFQFPFRASNFQIPVPFSTPRFHFPNSISFFVASFCFPFSIIHFPFLAFQIPFPLRAANFALGFYSFSLHPAIICASTCVALDVAPYSLHALDVPRHATQSAMATRCPVQFCHLNGAGAGANFDLRSGRWPPAVYMHTSKRCLASAFADARPNATNLRGPKVLVVSRLGSHALTNLMPAFA